MFDHSTAKIYKDNNGFIRIDFKKDALLTKETAEDYIQILDELCVGLKHSFLLETSDTYGGAKTEFLKIMGNAPEAIRWRKADAIIVNSIHIRLLANLYAKFKSPYHPVKVFTDQNKAIEWLSQF